jgi:hypothetical protein
MAYILFEMTDEAVIRPDDVAALDLFFTTSRRHFLLSPFSPKGYFGFDLDGRDFVPFTNSTYFVTSLKIPFALSPDVSERV